MMGSVKVSCSGICKHCEHLDLTFEVLDTFDGTDTTFINCVHHESCERAYYEGRKQGRWEKEHETA